MKQLLRIIFIFVGLVLLFIAYQYRTLFTKTTTKDLYKQSITTKDTLQIQKIRRNSKQLSTYAKANHYNQNICFLLDMSIPSGKNRFFVFNMLSDSIVLAGLVAHGSGDNTFTQTPTFSNTINSGCTSLGKYKISYQYKGKFGKAYKLIGLDSSNNNAFKRNVVLHAYSCVPNNEPYPLPICNSLGCPMVSYTFLEALHPIITTSTQPILMCIYH